MVHAKHHTDLLLINFYSLHKRADNPSTSCPISFVQSLLDTIGKFIKATQNERQLAL